MAKKTKRKTTKKKVATIKHSASARKKIPTAEHEPLLHDEDRTPIQVAFERRNPDLDPQLVWRGKDQKIWSDLVVPAPPVYIQEKVHPKVLIDDLVNRTEKDQKSKESQADLFSDFDSEATEDSGTGFYQHDQNWSNRMILGDALNVMASLAEREGLRGKVQCIYIDPPYGIKFNSNFQWSTTSRDVKDGKADHITREPEQVKAFRDTWRDGIHSYLTYLRDRLTVARDLLTESGSIFVQIGDENVHRVRTVMDEIFGEDQFISQISMRKSSGLGQSYLKNTADFVLWYARHQPTCKFRSIFREKRVGDEGGTTYKNYLAAPGRLESLKSIGEDAEDDKIAAIGDLSSSGATESCIFDFNIGDRIYKPTSGKSWKTTQEGMKRLLHAGRMAVRPKSVSYIRLLYDYPIFDIDNIWTDVVSSFMDNKVYVVQTNASIIQRCILMATDPGDLVLDPTCGSGTTATVAEQWGRRWITIDTSRVALALARARIMGARYPYYLLADSREGQLKEAEVARSTPSESPVQENIRQGFVYERVPHITLKSIANNTEIDVIWDQFQEKLEPLREQFNKALSQNWEEWEIPRDVSDDWSSAATTAHAEWWKLRIERQKEIDASIAAKADFEYLYDKPYEDKSIVRVAGPFTVESLSPHRSLTVDEDDELVDGASTRKEDESDAQKFVSMVLENLKMAGVQQAHKEDKISFSSVSPWPGAGFICAEGRYVEGDEDTGVEKRAAIFVGPEFGTVTRPDLVAAAREAADTGFDVLVTCAFNYDAHSTDLEQLGKIPVLKARMNADLHMADDLKNTGAGNLFVVFGEPDIEILDAPKNKIQIKINGVDVFHPRTGEVISDNADGIACWFIDTDYNEESFFVRHAYFLGAGDPYKSLKTSLKAEIDQEAWSTLNSDTSRPFDKPQSGRIAVKVINHLGDEVMKIFRVS